MYRLVRTCGACPEQYDVFFNDEEIGYLRLRHGHFRAEYRGTIVYESYPRGNGMFKDNERKQHLDSAMIAIHQRHKITTLTVPQYYIEVEE